METHRNRGKFDTANTNLILLTHKFDTANTHMQKVRNIYTCALEKSNITTTKIYHIKNERTSIKTIESLPLQEDSSQKSCPYNS